MRQSGRGSKAAGASDEEAALVPTLAFEEFAARYLCIRTKSRGVRPLALNGVQRRMLAEQTGRDVYLKARQFGVSTLVAAQFFVDTIRIPGTFSMVVAQDAANAQGLFHMVKLFLERLPEEWRPRTKYSSRTELYFPSLESWYVVGTARGAATGRSKTINRLHCSEYAYWPDGSRTLAGLLEAVPSDGKVAIESTPAAYGDDFHQRYRSAKSGESSFRAHFFPWFLGEEYRVALGDGERLERTDEEVLLAERSREQHGVELCDTQLKWRRMKKADQRERYAAEYPDDDASCFLASGRPRFDREKLRVLAGDCKPPRHAGRAALRALWPNGAPDVAADALALWSLPRVGRAYVIGADPAEGTERGDYAAAYVVDWLTLEQVARVYGRLSPGHFAEALAVLGERYNGALIASERNNHGQAVLLALTKAAYPAIYAHEPFDTVERTTLQQRKYGWPANGQTKPIAVARLDEAIEDEALVVRDETFIEEALGYVYLPDGSTGAQAGQHDDLVSAMYVALEAHAHWTPPSQQPEPEVPQDPWG